MTNARLFEEAEARQEQLEALLAQNHNRPDDALAADMRRSLEEIGRLAEQLNQAGPLNTDQTEIIQTIAQTVARLTVKGLRC